MREQIGELIGQLNMFIKAGYLYYTVLPYSDGFVGTCKQRKASSGSGYRFHHSS